MAYQIAVQRLDGTHMADDKIFGGRAPKYGEIVEHECVGEKVRYA